MLLGGKSRSDIWNVSKQWVTDPLGDAIHSIDQAIAGWFWNLVSNLPRDYFAQTFNQVNYLDKKVWEGMFRARVEELKKDLASGLSGKALKVEMIKLQGLVGKHTLSPLIYEDALKELEDFVLNLRNSDQYIKLLTDVKDEFRGELKAQPLLLKECIQSDRGLREEDITYYKSLLKDNNNSAQYKKPHPSIERAVVERESNDFKLRNISKFLVHNPVQAVTLFLAAQVILANAYENTTETASLLIGNSTSDDSIVRSTYNGQLSHCDSVLKFGKNISNTQAKFPVNITNLTFSSNIIEKKALKDKPITEIQKAIKSNDLHAIESLISNVTDISFTGDDGKTLLHYAAEEGSLEVVELFIDKKLSIISAVDERGRAPLHLAALKGHLEIVKYFVEIEKVIVSINDCFDRTPLHFAAAGGHLGTVSYLIEKGADFNSKDRTGKTPLHWVIHNSYFSSVESFKPDRYFEVARYLVEEKGTDLYWAVENGYFSIVKYLNIMRGKIKEERTNFNVKNNNGETLLHLAAKNGYLDIVEYLIKEVHAQSDVKDYLGSTPLHLAAKYGHLSIVEYLVENKRTELDIKDYNGRTPLHLAAKNGHLSVVEYLIREKRTELNPKDNQDWTPLHWAVCNDYLSVARYLVEVGAELNIKGKIDNVTALHLAIFNHNLETVKLLVDKRADLSAKWHNGKTSLHLAAESGYLDTVKYIIKYIIEEKEANLDAKDDYYWTPLYWAVRNDHLSVAQYLVEVGAKLNIKSKIDNMTALHWAVSNNNLEMVKLLVDKRADLNAQDINGLTPLHLAMRDKNLSIIRLLVDKGALYWVARNGHLDIMRDTMRYLAEKESYFDINAKNAEGFSLLHLATESGNLEMVKYLMEEQGASLNIKSRYNWTPLHSAAFEGNLSIVQYFMEKRRVTLNAKSSDGWTPLHLAAENGHLEMVKYLIEIKRADPNVKNSDGWNPLHLAAYKGKLGVVQYFAEGTYYTSLNIPDRYGRTPLHLASESGQLNIVRYLVEKKSAGLNTSDEYGKNPLQLATANNRTEVISFLESKGNIKPESSSTSNPASNLTNVSIESTTKRKNVSSSQER